MSFEISNLTNFSGSIDGNTSIQAVAPTYPWSYYAILGISTGLSVLGFILNAIVIIVVYKDKRSLCRESTLIIHLAVMDILACCPNLLSIFFFFVIKYNVKISYNTMLIICKIAGPWTYFTLISSTATLTLICLERYRAVVHHTLSNTAGCRLTIVLVIVWIIDIIVIIPIMLITGVHPQSSYDCNVEYGKYPTFLPIYFTFLALCCYIGPAIAIGYCYTKIVFYLRKSTQMAISQNRQLSLRQHQIKSVAKMFIIITIQFFIMASPWLITLIANGYTGRDSVQDLYAVDANFMTFVILFTLILTISIPVTNATIYIAMSPIFRRAFSRWFSKSPWQVSSAVYK